MAHGRLFQLITSPTKAKSTCSFVIFSKYPFLSKIASKSGCSLCHCLQELISQYRPHSLTYTDECHVSAAPLHRPYHLSPLPPFQWVHECQVRTIKTITTQDTSKSLEEIPVDLQSTPVGSSMSLPCKSLHNWTLQHPGKPLTCVNMKHVQNFLLVKKWGQKQYFDCTPQCQRSYSS